jgi:prepilin-type N-terminal cleavage/methylation domain-containing protein
MRSKKGMTLVELIIALTILLVMASIMIGILNPIALVNKARDAQRKKDINRIKISFEDYFNDKGCYPNSVRVTAMMDKINCGGQVFMPWLVPWPCDPNSNPYTIVTGDDVNCPKWYEILATLENKSDNSIISGLIYKDNLGVAVTGVNYGVSSGNISLDKVVKKPIPQACLDLGNCYYLAPDCNRIDKKDCPDGICCVGENCYIGNCNSECKVDCCGDGCN